MNNSKTSRRKKAVNAALEAYVSALGGDPCGMDFTEAVTDLVTDIQHVCIYKKVSWPLIYRYTTHHIKEECRHGRQPEVPQVR